MKSEKNWLSEAKKDRGKSTGTICKIYSSLGKTFILSEAVLPNHETFVFFHIVMSDLIDARRGA